MLPCSDASTHLLTRLQAYQHALAMFLELHPLKKAALVLSSTRHDSAAFFMSIAVDRHSGMTCQIIITLPIAMLPCCSTVTQYVAAAE